MRAQPPRRGCSLLHYLLVVVVTAGELALGLLPVRLVSAASVDTLPLVSLPTSDMVIYDNALRNGWTDSSFYNLSAANACDGTHAVSAPCAYTRAIDRDGAISFSPPAPLRTSSYSALDWYVYLNGAPLNNFSIYFKDTSGTHVADVPLSSAFVVGTTVNGFTHLSVPVAALNPTDVAFADLRLMRNRSSAGTPSLWIDEVRLVGLPTIVVDRRTAIGTNRLALGVTHTQHSFDAWGDPLAVASGRALLRDASVYQNQHLMGWGALNPEPAPGVFNWDSLDRRVQLMRDTGAVGVITLCCAPDWMKGGQAGATDWSALTTAPLPEHYRDFAELARQVALRYPDVKYFQVWNELKGFWNDAENRWNYENYTTFYNLVYDTLKAVDPTIQVGGPYVVLDTWGGSQSNPSALAGPYGTFDQRPLDVIAYWLANKHGADFLAIDMGLDNKDGIYTTDEFTAAQKFVDAVTWIRQQPNGGASLPIWWAEWYATPYTRLYDLAHANAVMANALIRTAQSGAAVALVWGPQGDAQGFSYPEGICSDTGVVGGGQPTPYQATAQVFKEAFGPGTQLYQAASSPPVVVLASATKILLVNTAATAVTVSVDGMTVVLAGFEVRAL
jgi:hypothetical protein